MSNDRPGCAGCQETPGLGGIGATLLLALAGCASTPAGEAGGSRATS